MQPHFFQEMTTMNRFKFFTPLLTYLLPIFLAFALAACGGGGGGGQSTAS